MPSHKNGVRADGTGEERSGEKETDQLDLQAHRRPEASDCAVKGEGLSAASRLEQSYVAPAPTWKRAMDIIGALLGIILLAPLFFVIVVLIKTTSRGPAFFKQQRVGYLGEPFTMWKFRTMKVDVDTRVHQQYVTKCVDTDRALQKLNTDAQLLPLGKLLRRLCIDELPQFINVLGGSMSLVGPRPDVVPFDQYRQWHKRRFDVAPGMTGLWQVCGKNRTTFEEMMRLDVTYVQQRSLALDVKILLMTVPAVLNQLFEE